LTKPILFERNPLSAINLSGGNLLFSVYSFEPQSHFSFILSASTWQKEGVLLIELLTGKGKTGASLFKSFERTKGSQAAKIVVDASLLSKRCDMSERNAK
jgi:hypothetical protein